MSYPRDLDEYPIDELLAEVNLRNHRLALGKCDYCGRYGSCEPCRFPDRHKHAISRAILLEPNTIVPTTEYEQRLVDWCLSRPSFGDLGVSRFEYAIRLLTAYCPLPQCVRVELCPDELMGGSWGLCWPGVDECWIQILDTLEEWAIVETLAHEWAHAMGGHALDNGFHDDAWGLAFARCYRVINCEAG